MRIAIYHNLPSGGGKRALYEMTRRLTRKHEVDVYTLSCADHDFCDLRPCCRQHIVFPFNPLPLMRRPFGRLNQGIRSVDLLRLRALQRRVAGQIDATGYDVVFVHNCQYGNSPGLLSFLRTPSVYYCQEPPRILYEPSLPRPYTRLPRWKRMANCFDPFPQLYRMILAKLDRTSARSASRVLVNSAYSRESLYRAYNIYAWICYLGVDSQHFRPLSLPKTGFVLSVGAIHTGKGFDFLLHSLALIAPTQRPPLVVVSNFAEPRERGYLGQLSSQLGVTVEFRTLVSDEELVRLYNQALLMLYTPIMEPFGFAPIESMACSTPVVGVCEGGVRETVLHGETGLLTERDPHEFAEATESLLNDTERRIQYGNRGRRYVEKQWQWDRCVHNLEKHFADAAQQIQDRVV